MTTCFLFTQHLSQDSCLSLRINAQGEIDAPLAQRSFAEIKTLQARAQTYIILPSLHFSLQQIALPVLAEQKARAAIPFALEERLAQNVETLQFAFDRHHYQQGNYLVIVGDKRFLKEIISRLDDEEINFNLVTLDWFALKFNEVAVMESYVLINDASFQGALSPDLISFYPDKWSNEQMITCFPESNQAQIKLRQAQITHFPQSVYIFLAQRLLQAKPINLCQGELHHNSNQIKTKRLYQMAIAMSLLWLFSIIIVNSTKLFFLNKDLVEVDKKIATIYREFFPQSQQVVSPKIRISQLLQSKQNDSDLRFWTLLDRLTQTVKESSVTINQLRFQNQILFVTLATKNFAHLENFQTALEKNKVTAKQTQASMLNQQVVSTLELRL